LTVDAVVLNCVTQFNIVWRVGTFPFPPMSKCRRKTCCVTVAEPLFPKNISTANARRPSDQRCMMTEGFKPLYPAMCVSLRHLHRCRHGAKFKSSNGFCPTLYIHTYVHTYIYRVSQEERTKLREGVPYVKVYRYNPKHLYPKLNGYGDNGKRILKR